MSKLHGMVIPGWLHGMVIPGWLHGMVIPGWPHGMVIPGWPHGMVIPGWPHGMVIPGWPHGMVIPGWPHGMVIPGWLCQQSIGQTRSLDTTLPFQNFVKLINYIHTCTYTTREEQVVVNHATPKVSEIL